MASNGSLEFYTRNSRYVNTFSFPNSVIFPTFSLGVMTNYKGIIFYFKPDISFEGIGYVLKIHNMTLKFVPLNTKLPFKYCSSPNVETTKNRCWTYNEELFNKRQLYSFKSYLSI